MTREERDESRRVCSARATTCRAKNSLAALQLPPMRAPCKSYLEGVMM